MMTPSPLKDADYLKTWGLFTLCATVAGFVVGAVVGGGLGAVLGLLHTPASALRFICGFGAFVVGLSISYFLFRYFVSRYIVEKLTTPAQTEGFRQAA